ncbi:DNRLRE domain-containing protein [Puniceicoccales bacterium CK1056]|uniref:DNRLRE domain-containing protein n=1 Tax=Oceanipulchritudo coccoides TaxID=2706888 RepID=A0A6B2M5T6_9BACT|nr:DNRLRE domain-containing protein [Oceanipulchritudo coccoides]NDV63155.1 DNRLRE domain-containing protein [Oceanipulchritudo coccoides]
MNKSTRIFLSGLCATLVAASHQIQAESITLEPSKDNSMFEEADESNGQGTYLFAGQTAPRNNSARRRALLQFDLNGQIPAGAVIESVSLELSMNKTITGNQAMTLHRLAKDWGEGASDASGQEGRGTAAQAGDVTWTHTFYSDQFWSTVGGDYEPTPSATQSVAGGTVSSPVVYTWSDKGMVADVQSWIEAPETNFGWILIGLEGVTSAKRFYSREHTVAAQRPQLTITFSTPGAGWAGYLIREDGRSVDTDGWIGIVDVANAPWIYNYTLDNYLYAPEENINEAGGWLWVSK